MYSYYSEGFFGYGEKGDFKYFSFWHILPILLLIVSIILTFIFREKIRSFKQEKKIRFILAFVMIIVEMSYFWRLLYVGDESGDANMLTKLPLQLCQWGLICSAFALMSLNDRLFGINFFISLSFTTIALFMPAVITKTGPRYYRYYQFFLEHELPIYSVFYMMFVNQKKVRYTDIFITIGACIPLAILCMIANANIKNATFMYLKNKENAGELGKNLTTLFPNNQYIRFAIFFVIGIGLFHLEYLIYNLITNRKNKKIKKEEVNETI